MTKGRASRAATEPSAYRQGRACERMGDWLSSDALQNRRLSFDEHFEPAIDHASGVKGQRLDVHHVCQPLVAHHLLIDAIASGARFIDDPGKDHRLAWLELDAARKGSELA